MQSPPPQIWSLSDYQNRGFSCLWMWFINPCNKRSLLFSVCRVHFSLSILSVGGWPRKKIDKNINPNNTSQGHDPTRLSPHTCWALSSMVFCDHKNSAQSVLCQVNTWISIDWLNLGALGALHSSSALSFLLPVILPISSEGNRGSLRQIE